MEYQNPTINQSIINNSLLRIVLVAILLKKYNQIKQSNRHEHIELIVS